MNIPPNRLRPDLQVIADLVTPGSKVLDIGCGNGELLAWLVHHRQVDGRGLELSHEGVSNCVASGLSVIQGDADTDLAYYPDLSYDYVILSRTLQAMQRPREILEQLVRIGRHVIISLPNFGHWKNRLYLTVRGRMPVTRALSYQWYDTPNIHFCTLTDFILLCRECGIQIEKQLTIDNAGNVTNFTSVCMLANLFGEQGVFMLHRK